MRHSTGAGAVLGLPLMRAGRALSEFPLVAEQVLEVVVAPLRGRRGPGDFQAAGDRVSAYAGTEFVSPAKALLGAFGSFGIRSTIGISGGSVGLAEAMAADDERHSLLVVHRHAPEGFADIPRRGDRVGVGVRALRVDVNQPHLHGCERIFEIPVAGVALVGQPLRLGAPVNVMIRLPDVLAAATETEGLESHRFECDVAGQDHQVGPGNLAAILLLDRPEKATRLVQADVVRPTVERRKALLAPAPAAAAVC